MKKLTIEEIKQLSFEVLCLVADICEKNNISYSLTGGTLIGAVRHKGFIPWDDDIDIMLPRPDYNRFVSIVSKNDYGFELLSQETCGNDYSYPFAKACHRNTLVQESGTRLGETPLGVYVDIFPVDGMGTHFVFAKIRCMVFQFIHGLKITSNWSKYHKSNLRKWYYEPFRYVCYLLSRLLGRELIDKMLNKFLLKKKYESSVYAGRMVGDFGSKEIMEKKLFESKTKVEFEGRMFDAVADYDTFLTRLYGDYMTLPPVKKRVSHHNFVAYSYTE